MKTAWVTLGRNGDILNILPLVFHDFTSGNQPTVIVSKPYAGLLEGVTYAECYPWEGDYSRLKAAVDFARTKWQRVYFPQVYSLDGLHSTITTDSFIREMWRSVGMLDHWGKIPLVFDNRNPDREADLFGEFDPKWKPLLLVSTSGDSSPFPHRAILDGILKQVEDLYQIIDISNFRATRFYDLLGLYESAEWLIATDSGPLHLAQAVPGLKVVALVTNTPTPWHGSARRPNHAAWIRYPEFPQWAPSLVPMLRGTPRESKMVHVWNDYDRNDSGNIRRHSVAKQSWQSEYKSGLWIPCGVHVQEFARNAQAIGDPRNAPFVVDLINAAAAKAQMEDIIVLTNDDTVFIHDMSARVYDQVKRDQSAWATRWEFRRIATQPIRATIKVARAWRHVGADLFAFTRAWWEKHGAEMPDMLLSYEAWDLVLRKLITATGGKEIVEICAHETHTPFWTQHRECPGSLHNRELAGKWLTARGLTWD